MKKGRFEMEQFSRRRLLQATTVGSGLILLPGLLEGCGSSSTKRSGTRNLDLAFFADMRTTDPDVFYDIEGLAISTSVYDGLLRYAPNSTKLEGALASDWAVSSDKKTYTFNLRPNLKFSDGSPLDSSAVEESFKRRTTVDQGPAYMLAGVKGYSTPDKRTFVVTLKEPVSDFLDLMASAWGPKVINPAVFRAHAADQAKSFLTTHAAGSGPFILTKFAPGQGYRLERNTHYWGKTPYMSAINISVTPDVSTQVLKLRGGSLDAILHGLPLATLSPLKSASGIRVPKFSSIGTTALYLNPYRPELASAETRRAVLAALDIPQIVREVYGDTAVIPPGAYPTPLLPSELAPIDYPNNANAVKGALPKGRKISIAYSPDSSGVTQRLAEVMQQNLVKAKVAASVQQVQLSEVFGYRDKPKAGPDILIGTPTPDAAAPAAWASIVWQSKGGLNFFNYSNSRVDAALQAAEQSQSSSTAKAAFGRAGRLATEDAAVAPIAQVDDVMAMQADLTGIEHVPAYPWTLNLAAISRRS